MLQTAWNNDPVNKPDETDGLTASGLSVMVIGPNENSREVVVRSMSGPLCGVARQLPFYPDLDQIPKLLEMNYDVLAVDLDSRPEYALEVVETLGANPSVTVMVYSNGSDSDLMIRCMRAGAREFLTLPVSGNVITESLVRASARRSAKRPLNAPKSDGRLCVFWGAKGGSGATTIATNFAIAAAKETGQKVILIDLDLPLGDAVLNFGLTPQYSTVDALQNYTRLDVAFLSKLLVQHESGVSILAAPGKLVPVPLSTDAVDKVIQVARSAFDCVVVDSGSRFDLVGTALFDQQAHIYLVSQISIPELRNSNRLASEFFISHTPNFDIVLNRYTSSSLTVDDQHITKALTKTPQWKVPNDFDAVREMQNAAKPIALGDSGISKVIRQMARSAFGLPPLPEKKKKIMGLF